MTTDANLQDRIEELEQRARRFKLATTGVEGWENYFQSLIMQERDYFENLLTEVVAHVRREVSDEMKAMLDTALAMRIRGTFQAQAKYTLGDVVALDGASFIARRDDPGGCPGTGWQLLARQGSRGIAGPQGIAGKDAPRIVKWELDVASYTATPIMSDGTKGPGLELRALFAPENNAAA
jgi:hypothetical protein